MSATNFKTVNQTYRQLIGNGLTYHVPRFQRDYSWDMEEWEDLWQDLSSVIEDAKQNPNSSHYMGYLVLQSGDEKHFDVIDGQQRLTTLSIFVLAGLKNLQKLIEANDNATQNTQRLEQLRQTYVGYLDPITLLSQSKLTLNNNNDNFYQTYLITLNERIPQRNLKPSEHALRKAFEWFDKKITEYIKDDADKGVAIATFIGKMSDLMFFTVITVNDELNAYKVFETLNARGVKLSSTDLLKNYFFSIVDKNSGIHELNHLEKQWNHLVERLGSESLPDFLRIFWHSRYALVRHNELFKEIRKKISTKEGVFALLRDMDGDVDLYLSLNQPSNATNFSSKSREYAEILKMFSIKQPYVLLMSAYRKFDDSEFEKTLRACMVVSFRYNVICGFHTGDLERVYQKIAMKINESPNYREMIDSLREIYVTDEIFQANFADKILKTTQPRNKKVVRYILTELEYQQYQTVRPSLQDETYNIEHIYPQNPKSGWEEFDSPDGESMVYRLGNMVLCEKALNRDMGNLTFEMKKSLLKQSVFNSTQHIANYDSWQPQSVAEHQRHMAKTAASIWRISQLSS